MLLYVNCSFFLSSCRKVLKFIPGLFRVLLYSKRVGVVGDFSFLSMPTNFLQWKIKLTGLSDFSLILLQSSWWSREKAPRMPCCREMWKTCMGVDLRRAEKPKNAFP